MLGANTPQRVPVTAKGEVLAAIYRRLLVKAMEAEAHRAQAGVCRRCGSDIWRDGDLLRCLNCDTLEPAEDALRTDFERLAGELGGVVIEEEQP